MAYYSCYFSPTGGTKKAADGVAAGWGEPFAQIDLMKPVQPRVFGPEDLCLVAVPSYGGRVPEAALERLRACAGSGAAAVAVAVFGNRAIDDTLLELYDELTGAGFRCIAGVEAVAQHSLLPRFGAGRPDEEDLAQLKTFGQKLRQAVEENTLSPELKLPGNRPYRSYKGVPLKPIAGDGCIGCGLCAAQCPVGAIPELNFRTTDGRKCISCMHCVAVCPVHVRKVSRLLTFAAGQKMKKTCSDRKPNKLYL